MSVLKYRARLYPLKTNSNKQEIDVYRSFYGSQIADHGWLYGVLLKCEDRLYLVGKFTENPDDYCRPEFCIKITKNHTNCTIDENTLCAGLRVSNKLTIYQGDIISTFDSGKTIQYVIEFNTFTFVARQFSTDEMKELTDNNVINESTRIIGNIFENPELLEEK